jgi:hypothetical protein
MNLTDLNDIPHKVQYVTIDSADVKPHQGPGGQSLYETRKRHTPVTLDLDLNSNIHFEGMSQVIGLKIVEAYFMQIGGAGSRDGGVARLVDIICPQIPTAGQLLTNRGQVLARCPLDGNAVPQNATQRIIFDKQTRLMNRKTNYFNPISIKKLDFSFYELGANDIYQGLQNSREWTITLEITTIDTKEKPRNKDQQTLDALKKLIRKIDELNKNVRKLPDKEDLMELEIEKNKKYPFKYLVLIIALIIGGYVYMINKKPSIPVGAPMGVPMGVPRPIMPR